MSKSRVLRAPFVRERSSGSPVPASLSWQNCSGGTITSGTIAGGTCRGEMVHMKDIVTPGFSEIQARGGIVNTPMSRTQSNLRNKSGTVRYSSTSSPDSNYAVYTGDYTSVVTYWGPFKLGLGDGDASKASSCLNEATVGAKANVLPPTSLVAVTLAEAHKTCGLVGDALMRFYKATQAMRRGLPAQAIMQLLGSDRRVAAIPKGKRLAAGEDVFLRRWLETRYGWSPLLYDIQGMLESLAAKEKYAANPIQTARGRASKTFQKVTTYQPSPSSGGLTEPITFQKTVDGMVDCRAYVLYKVDPQWVTANAFGFTSMPLSMWELVPFSFVVDWLVNVGDWIKSVTPRVGVQVLAEGSVTRTYLSGERKIIAETPNVNWTSTGLIGWTDEAAFYQIIREPFLSSTSYPPVSVKLNPKRVLDAIALIVVGNSSRYRT